MAFPAPRTLSRCGLQPSRGWMCVFKHMCLQLAAMCALAFGMVSARTLAPTSSIGTRMCTGQPEHSQALMPRLIIKADPQLWPHGLEAVRVRRVDTARASSDKKRTCA